MDNIVMLCSSCDEGFAKKFEHCPHCGSRLQAFRLEVVNPSADAAAVRDRGTTQPRVSAADYSVTVIAEKNGGTRTALFAGALAVVVTTLLSGIVVNLFSKDLDVGSINDEIFNAVLVEELGEPIEKAPETKKDKGKGGGGGGDNDPTPASQGDRAPMRTDAQFAPSVSMARLTQPTIPIQMAIQGPINEKIDTSRYGVRIGGDMPSDGPGTGGGQGIGHNGGQGPGDGPGAARSGHDDLADPPVGTRSRVDARTSLDGSGLPAAQPRGVPSRPGVRPRHRPGPRVRPQPGARPGDVHAVERG